MQMQRMTMLQNMNRIGIIVSKIQIQLLFCARILS